MGKRCSSTSTCGSRGEGRLARAHTVMRNVIVVLLFLALDPSPVATMGVDVVLRPVHKFTQYRGGEGAGPSNSEQHNIMAYNFTFLFFPIIWAWVYFHADLSKFINIWNRWSQPPFTMTQSTTLGVLGRIIISFVTFIGSAGPAFRNAFVCMFLAFGFLAFHHGFDVEFLVMLWTAFMYTVHAVMHVQNEGLGMHDRKIIT